MGWIGLDWIGWKSPGGCRYRAPTVLIMAEVEEELNQLEEEINNVDEE